MVAETLSAELERLYGLEELKVLSSTLLGLDPKEVGGAAAKGSFARALAERCVEIDAVDALLDVVAASRRTLPPELVKKLRNGAIDLAERPHEGDEIGDVLVLRELGHSRTGSVYRVHQGGDDLRLRRLSRETLRRRREVQRYFAAARLVGGVEHEGLPSAVRAGSLDSEELLLGVAHTFVEGADLSSSLKERGGRHVNELLPLLWAVAEALGALHAADVIHGALHPGNVLVMPNTGASPRVLLLDAGAYHLRPSLVGFGSEAAPAWLLTAPPELLRGEPLDAQSDVYALGALMYCLMSGRGPHSGKAAIDVALGHLARDPEPLTTTAAGNGASPEVDAFVRLLLDKDRTRRPRDATQALEGLRRLWRASQRPARPMPEAKLEERFRDLIEHAGDDQKAAELEGMVDLGVSPMKLADSFYGVAREVRSRNAAGSERTVRRLLARAARLYEAADKHDAAEKLYLGLVKLDPGDVAVSEALDRLRKKLGRFEELIESLLERTEGAEDPSERAAYYAEIGHIYTHHLKDNEQAQVAYVQAFCEDPLNERYGEQIERLSGSRKQAWEEVLSRCTDSMEGDLTNEAKAALAYRAGHWYAEKLGRPELSLPWLIRAVELEPAHDRALAELAQHYRKSQQWSELGQTLLRRAEVAPPPLARTLRAEAADILASQLSNPAAAQELYQSVLAEDPGHEQAALGMVRQLRQSGERVRALEVLESRAAALSGEQRQAALCEIAETYELELEKPAEAERSYRQVLKENPQNADALRGLDRILTRGERFDELLEILNRQLELATTARQRVALLERVAALYDQEFLDREQAAAALEALLELDPQRASAVADLTRVYRSLERWEDLVRLYERQLASAAESERRVELGMQLGRVLNEQLKQPDRAVQAYEGVLQVTPSHAGALEALATLRAAAGDAENALRALDELADKAATPEARAEQYLRSAALLESRGDVSGALGRYQLAAAAAPRSPTVLRRVRQKYQALGNYSAAVQLLEEELSRAEGNQLRAKLAGEMALLCQRHLQDDERANAAAKLALSLDPANPEALRVQARVAYSEQRYGEAAKRLEVFIPQLGSMEREEAIETAFLYVDSLAEAGSPDRALSVADGLMDLLGQDASALLGLSELSFERGSAERTVALCDRLLLEHLAELNPGDLSLVHYRRGDSLFKLGRIAEAIESLERAIGAEAATPAPFRALAGVYAMREEWERVIETRYRELELVKGDDRVQTLVEIGEVAASKLHDTDYAARAFLLALDERPNDRNVLTKLMQLYSAHKDWPQLLQVISRLAEVVDEPVQKGKYLYTAAMLAARELGSPERALSYVDLALSADPDNEAAFAEGLKLRRQLRDYEGLKELLKQRAQQLATREDKGNVVQVLAELADVYEQQLGRKDQAVRVLESILQLEPGNEHYEEKLAQLYAAEPAAYFDQAVRSVSAWVRRDPYQPLPYKLLRKIYTEGRRADGAFLACQALHVLGQAEPDETRFFARMRDGEPPSIRRRLTAQEWAELINPEQGEPLLTALFAMIEPYIVEARAETAEAFGLSQEHRIDAVTYPYGVVQAVHYAADALGIPEPTMYQRQEDAGVLGFLPTSPPAILVGAGAFAGTLNPLETAFVAAQHVAYYQPGFYLRQLLPNLTALKAWLFAAIRLVKAKFPITPDLEAPVNDASRTLSRLATGARIEQLTHVVTKLLSADAALDLKRWVHHVDFSADRAGLAICHDLETAGALVQSVPPGQGSPSVDQRLENLIAYSVSEQYLELRARQGVSIDS